MIGTAGAEQLRITVYDKALLRGELTETVVDELRRILRRSGIDIEWTKGVLTSAEASLMIYESHSRGHDQEIACRARRDVALDIIPVAPPGHNPQALGMSQPFARMGLNVRVFYGRIRVASDREGRPEATVLAHVLAHEIGHVLLRSNAHTKHGLMTDVWDDFEYDWMRKGLMFFTAEQSRKMRETLRGDGCQVAESADTRNL
jgi:hypothetical protein